MEKDPRFKFVAVGEAHSACIDALGSSVWCWGAGSFGRCGHGEEADNMYPKQAGAWDDGNPRTTFQKVTFVAQNE